MAPSLPFDLPGFEINEISSQSQHITVHATSKALSALCPVCEYLSNGIHSHYTRRPFDLPCQEYTIRLQL